MARYPYAFVVGTFSGAAALFCAHGEALAARTAVPVTGIGVTVAAPSKTTKQLMTAAQAALPGVNLAPNDIANSGNGTCPTTKAGLTDGFQMFTYQLSADASASLNLYAKAEVAANDKVILYYFMWYKDLQDGSGSTVATCGSGVLLALKASGLQASASANLPYLAANAELNLANVQYKLRTFGVSGPKINAAVPNVGKVGKFDADAYAELLSSLDKIETAWSDDTTIATPQFVQINVSGPTPGQDGEAAIGIYAVGQMSKGVKCSDAKSNTPSRNAESDTAVTQMYQVIDSKACGFFDGGPSQEDRQKAAALLTKYHISVN